MRKFLFFLVFANWVLTLILPGRIMAAPTTNEYVITIQDHSFSPVELKIPANQKVKLRIENHDHTPEEFESYELKREKVVTGHGTITLYIGPLKPGAYKYFGEFNPKTAQGIIIAE